VRRDAEFGGGGDSRPCREPAFQKLNGDLTFLSVEMDGGGEEIQKQARAGDDVAGVIEGDFEAGLATRPRNLENDDLYELERVGIYSPSLLKFWLKTRIVPLARGFIGSRSLDSPSVNR